MRGGRLRKRVTFERSGRANDGGGGAAISWAPIGTVWGGYKPESSAERLDAGRLQSDTIGTLTVRSSILTRGLTSADRVIIDDVPHQIRAVTNPDQKDAGLAIMVERGVPT